MWANEAYPRINGSKRACIQVGASAANRVYPPKLLSEVVDSLLKKGWEVFLLGTRDEVRLPPQRPERLKNLAEHDLTFRKSAAVVNGADVFIGNDSALLHIAGGLSVPAVGLYAPFPSKLRTTYCPTTSAIDGRLPCSPCFHHENKAIRNHFPDHCPSKATKSCGALAEILPATVVQRAVQVARNIGSVEVVGV